MILVAFVALAALTLSPLPAPHRHRHGGHSEARGSQLAGHASDSGRWGGTGQARSYRPMARLSSEGLRELHGAAVADPNALYSQRARRRMATYLKLRLRELRELHLERAAAAIERRLPLSELLKGP